MKIGFIDLYLGNWHATHLPDILKKIATDRGADVQLAYAWAKEDVSPVTGQTTDEWCKTYGAERCATIAEVCEKSDCIAILSPTNPEYHLPFAKEVLPFGKPTFIDKPFAVNAKEAEEILAIAKEYNTPVYSSSALRYATEIHAVEKPIFIATTGGITTYEEYIIHQIEMVVAALGIGATGVNAVKMGELVHFEIFYPDGRTANMMASGDAAVMPFTVIVGNDKDRKFKEVTSDIFYAAYDDMVRFFTEKTCSFDPEETVEVMRIRDMTLEAVKRIGL
ncbi:MAG: Gfo/Idh/MocA family oxidoreductase [Clostridia bacterium]|nr:Gfo/Idh/MocA family oxidoreductase [Clostridia bacterium]